MAAKMVAYWACFIHTGTVEGCAPQPHGDGRRNSTRATLAQGGRRIGKLIGITGEGEGEGAQVEKSKWPAYLQKANKSSVPFSFSIGVGGDWGKNQALDRVSRCQLWEKHWDAYFNCLPNVGQPPRLVNNLVNGGSEGGSGGALGARKRVGTGEL